MNSGKQPSNLSTPFLVPYSKLQTVGDVFITTPQHTHKNKHAILILDVLAAPDFLKEMTLQLLLFF